MENAIKTIANITQIPDYTPEAVKSLIKRLKLTEKGFALLMNVSPMTVKLWTSGAVVPCNLSRRLIQIYCLCPEVAEKLAAGAGGE